MGFQALGNEKYISLETFKHSGDGVKTPVWVVTQNSKHYVWTAGNSWKVKRARNYPNVNITSCDQRGGNLGDWVPAVATVHTDKAKGKEIVKLLKKKYGIWVNFFQIMGKLSRSMEGEVVIELAPVLAEAAADSAESQNTV